MNPLISEPAAPERNSTPPAQRAEGGSRRAFRRLCDPEGSFGGDAAAAALRAILTDAAAEVGSITLDMFGERVRSWAATERTRFENLYSQAGDDAQRDVLVRRAALGAAPLAASSGCWLQWWSSAGNAEQEAVLDVLSLYAADLGVGSPRSSRGNAFADLLDELRLNEHAWPPARLAFDERIADGAFYLPALLLGVSRRPDLFRYEIIGADLCLRWVGLLPALALVRSAKPAAGDWEVLDPGLPRGGETIPERLLRKIVASAPDDAVLLGCAATFAVVRRWSDALYAELDAARDEWFEMSELVRRRAREAAIYHHAYRLADRSLAEWFEGGRTDPVGLLSALAGSRLVRPGDPDRSVLVRGLVAPRGPMFRVFEPAELAVIRRWIAGLVPGDTTPSSAAMATGGVSPLEAPQLALNLPTAQADHGRAPRGLREAYHRLVGRADEGALRDYAMAYVVSWLGRSREGIDAALGLPPAAWPAAGLRPWVAEQHDQHDREYIADADVPIPSRDELIDSTLQIAPLTLIDGGWLQGHTDYSHASSDVGHPLFRIYWDELGNGSLALNHPLIYREVLEQMGIELPPTASLEFAEWLQFRETSFELPVFWLAVSRFPQTFMPEILGLNVAMELSGVGGSYRRARIALATYGFSTHFVDIHNTIDNVVAGHSGWAADAVDAYMANLRAAQGSQACAEAWQRIRVGFRSLNPPASRSARRAGRRALRAAGLPSFRPPV